METVRFLIKFSLIAALYYANSFEMVNFLVGNGALVDIANHIGFSPMSFCVATNNVSFPS
jgi:hypothetical protein